MPPLSSSGGFSSSCKMVMARPDCSAFDVIMQAPRYAVSSEGLSSVGFVMMSNISRIFSTGAHVTADTFSGVQAATSSLYVSRPVLHILVLPSLSVTSKAPMSEGFTPARSKSSVSGLSLIHI